MASHEPVDESPHPLSEHDVYFLETYLRQRGDHRALLAIDALMLREDLTVTERVQRLQEIIQGVFHGERKV
jgi:hypothetical protein